MQLGSQNVGERLISSSGWRHKLTTQRHLRLYSSSSPLSALSHSAHSITACFTFRLALATKRLGLHKKGTWSLVKELVEILGGILAVGDHRILGYKRSKKTGSAMSFYQVVASKE